MDGARQNAWSLASRARTGAARRGPEGAAPGKRARGATGRGWPPDGQGQGGAEVAYWHGSCYGRGSPWWTESGASIYDARPRAICWGYAVVSAECGASAGGPWREGGHPPTEPPGEGAVPRQLLQRWKKKPPTRRCSGLRRRERSPRRCAPSLSGTWPGPRESPSRAIGT